MRSRALNLAALALLTGLCGSIGVTVPPAAAQQLDAGKPPAQIFAGTCSACHRSPRGLVRSVSPGSLPGFLRQHYTTGNDMAGTMASYVLSNGGTQQVAEPPPKQEPKQRPKSDGQDVAARTPPAVDPKAQSKAAKQQKAGKKGQAEPAAAIPPVQEPDKPEVAKPETPPAEPPKTEAAATDCKVEPAKEADESKPPKQPAALLTLPGFPAPEPEPEPEPAAQSGCEPASAPTVTAAARTDDQVKEQAKEQVTAPPQDQPKEQAKPQAPATPPPALAATPPPALAATPPPALAEAPKSEPLRATVTEAPTLDIMREEVHAPRVVRPSQKKRAPPPQ